MYLFIFDDSENSYYVSNGYNLDSALQDAYDYVGHGEISPDEFHDMIVRLGKEQSIKLFNVLSSVNIKSIYSGLEIVFMKEDFQNVEG